MKRFHFPLQALLEIRKRKEDQIKRRLGEKNREILNVKKDCEHISDELKGLQSEQKEYRNRTPDILMLKHSVAYRHKLKRDLIGRARDLESIRKEAGNIRVELVKATRDRRAIEIIREKRFAQWKKARAKKEQDFIDDITQTGFTRKKKSVSAPS